MKIGAYVLPAIFALLGSPLWAQPAINSATMTLIDNDGNGFANIGDEIEVSVVVDDAVMGTSVRVFNNDFFPGAGPYSLHKVTPGFGDGIEYALTMPIAPGSNHDHVTPQSVQFVVQVRLGGVTQDDMVDLTISGVTEMIDNVRPSVSNAIFSGSSSTLTVGDSFDVGVDASDGAGISTVQADLRRMGLGESMAVPFLSGDSYLLESEQVQEAPSGEQASLSENRSIVFSVSDLAGNTATYDSASDGQSRVVSNVTPAPPKVVAVQRATDFNNTQDLFDIVLSNGADPVDPSGDPLLDGSGQPITYADVMSGGQYGVFWSASGEPFQPLTTASYNNNGVLVQINLQFAEFAENKVLYFEASPVTSGGLTGASGSDDVVIQRGVKEAEVFFPTDGFVVGNGLETQLSELRARVVEGLEGYEATGAFRVYFRDNTNPAFQLWMGMVEQPDGTFLNTSSLTANQLIGSGFGSSMSVVARPTFSINGVNLRVLSPSVSFQNNPILTYYIDPDLLGDLIFRDRFESAP